MRPKLLSSKRLSFYARLCIVVLLSLWCVILSFRESPSRFSSIRSPSVEGGSAGIESSPQNETATVAPPPKIVVRKINEFLHEIDDFLSLVVDGSLELRPREMSAYWKLVRFIQSDRNLDTLQENAKPIGIESLIANPKRFRGALIKTTLRVHRVVEYTSKDVDGNDSELYEIWGSRDYARNWLWVMVTPELPNGYTKESLEGQNANFQGIFFKLQAYHPAKGKSSDPPLLAPFAIGLLSPQISYEPMGKKVEDEDLTEGLGFAPLVVMAAVGSGVLLYRRLNRFRYRIKSNRNGLGQLDWIDNQGSVPIESEGVEHRENT